MNTWYLHSLSGIVLLWVSACSGGGDTGRVRPDIPLDSDPDTGPEPGFDYDGDGVSAAEGDCNDANVDIHPGATEVCDGLDNDCNSQIDDGVTTTWFRDDDADGYGLDDDPWVACALPDGYASLPGDCDDTNAGVNPSGTEVCNAIDDNCDGVTDTDATDPSTWYADSDLDGYGDDSTALSACDAPPGYVASGGDCDESNTAFNPGASEADCADPNDYNCDGSTGYADADEDGSAACEDCDDANADVMPGGAEVCDALDNDCDGTVDGAGAIDALVWYADSDSDSFGDAAVVVTACEAPAGFVADALDCDDSRNADHPGGVEVCDHYDNDCDGVVDLGALDAGTWYADVDLDGFGDVSVATTACDLPVGYCADATDCDDTAPASHPGATEVCDGADNDCNVLVDDGLMVAHYADADSDGFGDPTARVDSCSATPGYVTDNTDCDDAARTIFPGAPEVCDGLDDDCDSAIDEGVLFTFYSDSDRDGFGDMGAPLLACSLSEGLVADATDCNDGDRAINPGEDDVCDDMDNDCDGMVDDDATYMDTWYADADGDAYGDPESPLTACDQPGGSVVNADDCDDSEGAVHPGVSEVCDFIDNDCDGVTDTDAIDLPNCFVEIPAGTFQMGTGSTEHSVTLTHAYLVGVTEVTQGQFQAAMGYNPSRFTSCGADCPVERLSWHESAAYANAVSREAGLTECYTCTGGGSSVVCDVAMNPYDCDGYRLLTEAEWEGVARCGTDLDYSGSNSLADVGWYSDNSGSTTHAAAELEPSACGTYDMSGNVWEWTQDWYDSYPSGSVTDPVGASSGTERSGRGGCWYHDASMAIVTSRTADGPTNIGYNMGFRLGRSR